MNAQFPDPQRVRVDTVAAINDATDRLLNLAQQSIAIFDVDLRDEAWNARLRCESLERFLLASRGNRMRVVLNDCDYVDRHHARLMQLLRQFSERLEFRLNATEWRHLFDPFVLVDRHHYLHRFHYEHARAEFAIAQPEPAQELALRFEALWQASEPGLSATVLGL
jgi:hypothetical protein